MIALVDTCVIIDVLQAREPFLEDSKRVLLASASASIDGRITAKSLTDIFYVMHGYYHQNEPCLKALQSLFKVLTVVDTTANACLQACFSQIGDYEEAVMDETARAIGADAIVTRNVRDYRKGRTPVITPHELVAQLGLDAQGMPPARPK